MLSTMTASQNFPLLDHSRYASSYGYDSFMANTSRQDDIINLTTSFDNIELTNSFDNIELDEELDLDYDLDLINFSNHDRLENVTVMQTSFNQRTSTSHSGGRCEPVDMFHGASRTSHLSGGGLVGSTSRNDYMNVDCFSSEKEKRYSSHFSGGGLISINDNDEFDEQISPSTPLSFHIPTEEHVEFSSTNPFRNFSSTNPFITSPGEEDEELPEIKPSPSQCSTRPASPSNNPFTSPVTNNPSQPSRTSSFVFALPIIPVLQSVSHSNSSTQTEEVPEQLVNNNHSENDLICLMKTMKNLRTSGWYYENTSWQESMLLLKNSEPGTFLVRDSSDPNFLFSLSVQTPRGPTSVRLHYINGKYRLDAEEKLVPHMPFFDSVLELVDYYIEHTVKNKSVKCSKFKPFEKLNKLKEKRSKSKEQVWIDAQGNIYSNILLVKPLYKKNHISSLQHLSRLAINRQLKTNNKHVKDGIKFNITPVYDKYSPFHFTYPDDDKNVFSEDPVCDCENCTDLPLPNSLIDYLKEYPYCH